MKHCKTYALVFECKDESRESASNVLTIMNDVINLIGCVHAYINWTKKIYINDKYGNQVTTEEVEPLS